ncbi:MAG: ATP-dependent helicase HrpB [bacterium]|nr:ATP-dependent helicase HrpB [bacterium]
MTALPIEAALPALRAALRAGPRAVVCAPPGTGKTTGVPRALLDEPWLHGRAIVLLEPRRLAARAAAYRMADLLGEPVGQTVGYRVRLDSCVSAATRIEVVTEGILTRRLQHDPELHGVGCVIFDEFHERSIHADLGLALTLDMQQALRPDLRVLVMSATLDADAVAALLHDAPVITAQGSMFEVETVYAARRVTARTEDAVVAATLAALRAQPGDVLVFLPGAPEIHRVHRALHERLTDKTISVLPLFSNLPRDSQDRAIRPSPAGMRKIVLATTIAETSLTIDGVRVVIDSGLTRVPQFDPPCGMTRLLTVRVSQAAAAQRRGRAGRTAPGVCYRLWTAAEQEQLPAAATPEIRAADLAQFALELAAWGVRDPATLRWLDPPPAGAYAQARELLQQLDALDDHGAVTPHGKAMSELGLHPRLAHMILQAEAHGQGSLACDLAALLSEAASGARTQPDICLALDALHARTSTGDADGLQRVRATAHALQRARRLPKTNAWTPHDIGRVLAFAYPDRIAQRRRDTPGEFLLANGRAARFAAPTLLAQQDWLVVADLDAGTRTGRIHLAAPYTFEDLVRDFRSHLQTTENVVWDTTKKAVTATRSTCCGALILKEEPLRKPAPTLVCAALLVGLRQEGLDLLPWTRDVRQLQARIAFLRAQEPEYDWPDISDAALECTLETWLAPHLAGVMSRNQLAALDLGELLRAQLSWPQRRQLDEHAPTHITVPSGSNIRLDYTTSDAPVLAVRIQEMFGLHDTPRVAGGRVPVLVHLLSPAQRPVQVTRDLASFWRTTYAQVRKDLRGRYPKHAWPEDPTTAPPTRRLKQGSKVAR